MTAAHENPFRTRRVEALPFQFTHDSWPRLLQRLEQLNHRAAIVGPHGMGKTTLLVELAQRLRERDRTIHHLRFTEEQPHLLPEDRAILDQASGQDDVVMIDSCECLGWLEWQRVKLATCKAGGLVITAHHPGRLPALIEMKPSMEILDRLLGKLLPTFPCPEERLALFNRHKGNIRDIFRELYDRHAQGV